ncbi:MAG: TIGR02452 family protein [Lachnospiraceae bacterium]|nr:TIGR02452 family protein [Lachnospiraceae bacterium]
MAQGLPTYECDIKVISADTFNAAGGDLTPVSLKKIDDDDEKEEDSAENADETSADSPADETSADASAEESVATEEASAEATVTNEVADAEVHENISGYKTLVLNFASGSKPGGGVESGANAQEEALCRRSTLYASISSETASEMYRMNRLLGPVDYLDYMLLSPLVTVIFDSKFKPLDNPFKTAVLTAPAVPLNRDGIKIPNDYVRFVMRKRIRNVMRVSAMNGYDRLILGAWGCGAYGHDAFDIASYFREVLFDEDYKKYFKEIIFAIYAKNEEKDYNYQTFAKVLAPDYVKEAPKFIGFLQPNKEYGFLSNSFRCEFTDNNGVKYTSVDQYLMYQKALSFNDAEAAKRILAVNDPAVVRDFGRKVRNYDDELWKGKRQLILNDAIQMKFSQNAGLQGMLINTGDALLAECNPHETVYGIGVSIFTKGIDNKENWSGANLTGHTLMSYRDKLKGTYSV